MGSAASANKMHVGNKKFAQNYMLARELGSGAFSVVKLAMHLETGQKAAVKIVSKKKLSDEDYQALMMEIQILSELDHPHIIKLFETYDEGTDFYIVTELVAGGELFDRIVAKAHYTEKEARDLIKIMLETMAYMHKMGIVHRDLKPENLLLCSETDDSDIKIADFGFAKRVKDLSPKETACGTPGYVAPEILRGDKYGAEVDVWSMGVICYVLLAGYPPFYDEDQKRLFKKIKEGRYHFHEDYWGNVSPEAIHMIQQMLCVDQSKRWTSEQLLSHPWIVMGDETLQAKDLQQSIVVLRKFNARRRLRAAADAVILANRMQKLFAKATGGSSSSVDKDSGSSVKKAMSMIDPTLLKDGNEPSEDASGRERRNSFDSDLYGDSPSMNPALDLLNDKDLENV
eukprot:CAMPEP_0173154120 /NCGR_PEP_ID=MMETSP1105-20130129/13288_1 /TAXON_ID=2985 /ORGANISM="Ochromonas sp., Strain BG-1" /LENGTH=399 /DNA_ID=CAMNT_0014070229 /DNA_START=350 /DNA_END=1549 /DNA_ORIENTATION=+